MKRPIGGVTLTPEQWEAIQLAFTAGESDGAFAYGAFDELARSARMLRERIENDVHDVDGGDVQTTLYLIELRAKAARIIAETIDENESGEQAGARTDA